MRVIAVTSLVSFTRMTCIKKTLHPSLQMRLLSSQVIRKNEVGPHLELHSIKKSENEPVLRGHDRSLVILFPFHGATSKILERYRDLYHQHGYDVLLVKNQLKHFLWPYQGFTLAREVLHYLSSNELPLSMNNYHIHSFSLGACIYTFFLIEIDRQRNKYGNIQAKIRSQVFDSIVYGGFDRMSKGITDQFDNTLIKMMINVMFSSYILVTQKYTKDVMEAAIDYFITRPVKTPILFYYSLDDPLCSIEDLQKLIDKWLVEKKMDVHVKCWENSVHAGHLRIHPEQYKGALDAFMIHVDKKMKHIESKL